MTFIQGSVKIVKYQVSPMHAKQLALKGFVLLFCFCFFLICSAYWQWFGKEYVLKPVLEQDGRVLGIVLYLQSKHSYHITYFYQFQATLKVSTLLYSFGGIYLNVWIYRKMYIKNHLYKENNNSRVHRWYLNYHFFNCLHSKCYPSSWSALQEFFTPSLPLCFWEGSPPPTQSPNPPSLGHQISTSSYTKARQDNPLLHMC